MNDNKIQTLENPEAFVEVAQALVEAANRYRALVGDAKPPDLEEDYGYKALVATVASLAQACANYALANSFSNAITSRGEAFGRERDAWMKWSSAYELSLERLSREWAAAEAYLDDVNPEPWVVELLDAEAKGEKATDGEQVVD